MNSWILIIIAGIFEMLWVLELKLSQGFTQIIHSILVVVFMVLSLVFLSMSFDKIPMGTAYACWTAIGAVSICIVGMLFFNEPHDFLRILFLTLVIIGIVGLKFTSAV
ncbi:QacE family quaternary ammonium compound efflux SMR transporter [Methanobrevibacter sp. 87.7]|uniref:DMT family transporter n=1 Tax=Methanobrevibacter sp. 87.7 TaxID=387957 RepID=UPI000B50BAB4|nr:multidrug efflux SMR transporter [Methanobrevibacter sp. 87.7]OWT32654.1 QacE family quaternary ammonium compound efflux SMR transporter [Methanobrevibacter sp. 87.7]